jgi:N-acetylmuramic acid 6-phosphate etherase
VPDFIKYTEQPSNHEHLEKMSIGELLQNMNREDHSVAVAVQKSYSANSKVG